MTYVPVTFSLEQEGVVTVRVKSSAPTAKANETEGSAQPVSSTGGRKSGPWRNALQTSGTPPGVVVTLKEYLVAC